MLDYLSTHMVVFLFVFIRVTAILMALPIWSGRIPGSWKVGAGLWMSVLFSFVVPPVVLPETLTLSVVVVGMFREAMTGILMGFIMRLFLGGVMLAGQMAGYGMGLAIANVYDPATSEQISIVASLFNIFLMFLFLEVDGHLVAVRIVARSFEWVPPFCAQLNRPMFLDLVRDGGREVFRIGLQLAWPFSLTLLMVYLAMGLLARMAPQMNMMMVAFPITILIGFFLLMMSIGPLTVKYEQIFRDAFSTMEKMLVALRG